MRLRNDVAAEITNGSSVVRRGDGLGETIGTVGMGVLIGVNVGNGVGVVLGLGVTATIVVRVADGTAVFEMAVCEATVVDVC